MHKLFSSVFRIALGAGSIGFGLAAEAGVGSLSAPEFVECVAETELAAQALRRAQDEEAQASVGLPVRPKMASQFYPGSTQNRFGPGFGRAALLLHGLNASPFEVEALSRRLASGGFTVWAPLLAGFGVNGEFANKADVNGWRRTVEDGLDLLAHCHADVAMAGMSLGGGVVADALFPATEFGGGLVDLGGAYRSRRQPGLEIKVSSATFVSPYFAPYMSRGTAFAILRTSAAWRPVLPVWMAALFGGADLRAVRLYPDAYLQEMPLHAVIRAIEFSSRFEEIDESGLRSSVPATLAYSEADRTVDWKRASEFVPARFTNSFAIRIPARERVPHQILVPGLNSRVDVLIDSIVARIIGSN